MKLPLPLLAAVATIALAGPALADQPAQEGSEPASNAQAEAEAEKPADAEATVIEIPAITAPESQPEEAAAEPEEEALICRSIRLDMSSRRKTRVCRTEEGWRQLNQQR